MFVSPAHVALFHHLSLLCSLFLLFPLHFRLFKLHSYLAPFFNLFLFLHSVIFISSIAPCPFYRTSNKCSDSGDGAILLKWKRCMATSRPKVCNSPYADYGEPKGIYSETMAKNAVLPSLNVWTICPYSEFLLLLLLLLLLFIHHYITVL